MSDLLVIPASSDADGRVITASPQSAGWRYVRLDLYELGPNQTVARNTGDREVLLVFVSGLASVKAGGLAFPSVGGRVTPIDGPPDRSTSPRTPTSL